ncbi:MAG: HD-GYP domain-containing protein [Lachnospiraceae bacterium]|nr:HD-GYP domain-containing protein [Lachnospiraceae bacterium]
MKNREKIIEYLVKSFCYSMFLVTLIMTVVALFAKGTDREANIGSFESETFNKGWVVENGDTVKTLDLPATVDAKKGQFIYLRNKLPDDIPDDSSLMVRVTLQDIVISIDGKERSKFLTEYAVEKSYYSRRSYVVVELNKEDSGKEIEISLFVKDKGILNEVLIGPGNNVVYKVLHNDLRICITAIIVFALGFVLMVLALIIEGSIARGKSLVYFALMMMDIGIWVFSECGIRQLLLPAATLCNLTSYFSVEILGIFAALFFNEIQGRRRNQVYVILEIVSCFLCIFNCILHFTGVLEFHDTLIFVNIWLIAELVVLIAFLIMDIRSGEVKKYLIISAGIAMFVIMAGMEFYDYYTNPFHTIGFYMCIGLILLMIATLVQMVMDIIYDAHERQNVQMKMVVNTIKTIAGAIDAKDEYTGGHSERVGLYVAELAKEMADDYSFSEEDIRRVRYIGTLHDIGKIGVADNILNKGGQLNDYEFELMKKHALIGGELMKGMDNNLGDLEDGIRFHHERYDGKGYPEGREGSHIPLIARMLCLADCYDAMTSNRLYRNRLDDLDVRDEILKGSGTQFDPELTDIFVKLLDEGKIVPITLEGMSVNKEGDALQSSLLALKLSELQATYPMKNMYSSHIRMLYFIMKLMERKGINADSYIVKASDADTDVLTAMKPFLGKWDMCIRYNDEIYLVVVFDKKTDELKSFETALKRQGKLI